MKMKKNALMIASLSVLLVQSCALDGKIKSPLPLKSPPLKEMKIHYDIETFMEIENLVNSRASVSIVINDDVYFFENGVLIADKEYTKKFYEDAFIVTEVLIIAKSYLASEKTISIGVKDLYESDSKNILMFLEKRGFLK